MTKEELLDYYLREISDIIDAKIMYKNAEIREKNEEDKIAKAKGLQGRWQLEWNERVDFTSHLKKYSKSKFRRCRLTLQELLLEWERNY